MRLGSLLTIGSALLLSSTLPASASPHVRRGPTAPHSVKSHGRAPSKTTISRISMEPERATQIQTALIKAGYMTGTPTGVWDAQSQAAMEKLQAENGWQTKIVPDSRAIIKLGLGPHAASTTLAGTPSESSETSSASAEAQPAHATNQ